MRPTAGCANWPMSTRETGFLRSTPINTGRTG
jgi:hypothetical protein